MSLRPSLSRICSSVRLAPMGCPHAVQMPLLVFAEVPLSVALVKPVVPSLSISFSLPLLAGLVRAAVCADARVAGLVGVVILVVPLLAGDVLVALPLRARRAERGLEAGLLRGVGAGDLVHGNVRRTFDRPR